MAVGDEIWVGVEAEFYSAAGALRRVLLGHAASSLNLRALCMPSRETMEVFTLKPAGSVCAEGRNWSATKNPAA
jgi:hypothetical protein